MFKNILMLRSQQNGKDREQNLSDSRSKHEQSNSKKLRQVMIETKDKQLPYIYIYKSDESKKQKMKKMSAIIINIIQSKIRILTLIHSFQKLNQLRFQDNTHLCKIHLFTQITHKIINRKIGKTFSILLLNTLRYNNILIASRLLKLKQINLRRNILRYAINKLTIYKYDCIVTQLTTIEVTHTINKIKQTKFSDEFMNKVKLLKRLHKSDELIDRIKKMDLVSLLQQQQKRFECIRMLKNPKIRQMYECQSIIFLFQKIIKIYLNKVEQIQQIQFEEMQNQQKNSQIWQLKQKIINQNNLITQYQNMIRQFTKLDCEMKKENDGQILGEELLILIKDQSSRLEANKNQSNSMVLQLINSRINMNSLICDLVKDSCVSPPNTYEQFDQLLKVSNNLQNLQVFMSRLENSQSMKALGEIILQLHKKIGELEEIMHNKQKKEQSYAEEQKKRREMIQKERIKQIIQNIIDQPQDFIDNLFSLFKQLMQKCKFEESETKKILKRIFQLKQIENKNVITNRNLQGIKRQLKQKQFMIGQVQNQNKRLKLKNDDMMNKIRQDEQKINDLIAKNAELNETASKMAEYQQKIKDLSSANLQLTQKINSIKQENSKINVKIGFNDLNPSQCKSSSRLHHPLNDKLLKKQTDLMKQLLTLKIQNQNIVMKYQNQISNLKHRINQYQTTNHQLSLHVSTLKTSISRHEAKYKSLEADFNSLNSANKELKRQLAYCQANKQKTCHNKNEWPERKSLNFHPRAQTRNTILQNQKKDVLSDGKRLQIIERDVQIHIFKPRQSDFDQQRQITTLQKQISQTKRQFLKRQKQLQQRINQKEQILSKLNGQLINRQLKINQLESKFKKQQSSNKKNENERSKSGQKLDKSIQSIHFENINQKQLGKQMKHLMASNQSLSYSRDNSNLMNSYQIYSQQDNETIINFIYHLLLLFKKIQPNSPQAKEIWNQIAQLKYPNSQKKQLQNIKKYCQKYIKNLNI